MGSDVFQVAPCLDGEFLQRVHICVFDPVENEGKHCKVRECKCDHGPENGLDGH